MSDVIRKVLVCGGRHYSDRGEVYGQLDFLSPACIIEGGASGADALARKWAEARGVCSITVRANWVRFGRGGGPVRNRWMLDHCEPDLVVAFPGGAGTANMVSLARAAGVDVMDLRDMAETDDDR